MAPTRHPAHITLPPDLLPILKTRVDELGLRRSHYLVLLLRNHLLGDPPKVHAPCAPQRPSKEVRKRIPVSIPEPLWQAIEVGDLSASQLFEALIRNDCARTNRDFIIRAKPR